MEEREDGVYDGGMPATSIKGLYFFYVSASKKPVRTKRLELHGSDKDLTGHDPVLILI